LVSAGADLNIPSEKGFTAVALATMDGHAECVKTLIDAGANLNVVGDRGYTALIMAACEGRTAIVKQLVNAGADLDLANNDGMTALDMAVKNNYDDDDVLKEKRVCGEYLHSKGAVCKTEVYPEDWQQEVG